MNPKAPATPELIHPPYDSVPLFVDLDGTLIKTDLIIESVFSIIKKQPLMMIVMLYWLLVFGKTRFQEEVALRTAIDFNTIPLQRDFVEFLRHEDGFHVDQHW